MKPKTRQFVVIVRDQPLRLWEVGKDKFGKDYRSSFDIGDGAYIFFQYNQNPTGQKVDWMQPHKVFNSRTKKWDRFEKNIGVVKAALIQQVESSNGSMEMYRAPRSTKGFFP